MAVEQAIPELIRTVFRPLGSFKIKDRPDPVMLYEISRLAKNGYCSEMGKFAAEEPVENWSLIL